MHGARRLKPSERLSADARYELLLRLAAGGMGAVFVGVPRAADGPLYAIKRAHPHLAEHPDFRKMFVAEARLARRIGHPNAIGVIDVDESDGELLMVMRFVEGGSLSDMLQASHGRGRRIAPQVTLRVIVDAARGLDAAHEVRDEMGRPLGIVHRDVSPHNILVGVDGVAAIVDFGVAKAASVDMTATATDVLKGKSAYMAPEYVKARVANAQTDVFGLGVVAWEAMANRRLFKGEDELDTMRRLLDPAPAPMLHQIVEADATVAAVIARALAKDPAKRFPTARAFADAIETAARTADQLAEPAEVAAAVKSLLASDLAERRELLAAALAERGRASAAALPPAAAPPSMAASSLAASSLAATAVAPRPTAAAAPVAATPAADRTVAAATQRRGPLQSTAPMMASAFDAPPAPTMTAAFARAQAIQGFEEPAPTITMPAAEPLETTPATRRAPSGGETSRRTRGLVIGVLVSFVVAAALAALLVPAVRRAREEPVPPPALPAEVAPLAGDPGAAVPQGAPDPVAAADASTQVTSEPPPAPGASASSPAVPSSSAGAAPSASAAASAPPSSRGPTSRPASSGWRPKANPY
jgi:tRNA A-37 threonylcarbamoyl transferase component Bud32